MRAGRATERIQINRHFMHSSSGAAARPDKCVLARMANVGGRTGQKKGASSSWQTQMMPRGCVDGRLNFTPCCRGERDGAKCSIGVQSTHSCDFDMRVLPRMTRSSAWMMCSRGCTSSNSARTSFSGAMLGRPPLASASRRQVVAPRLGRSGCGADLNETHQSTTDEQARLFRKSKGTGAMLCYMGHVLTDRATYESDATDGPSARNHPASTL
jgi:hypothetical protein